MTTDIVNMRNWKKAIAASTLFAGAVVAVLTATVPTPVRAVENPPAPAQREVIPGADKMTSAERETYRRRIEAASTPEEKAKIRSEYAKTSNGPAPERALVGDPVRGAAVISGCFSCHGMERFVAPATNLAASFIDSVLRASGLSDLPPAPPARFKGRITSMAALRDAVARRNDYLNPKMTPQEFEDVIAYLNAEYYKFPQ